MVDVVISSGSVVRLESEWVVGECWDGENKGELLLCDVESREEGKIQQKTWDELRYVV